MKGMGKAIRRYREEAGITQERLAELVDISTNHLGAIEREVKTLTMETFVKLLNVLGAEPNEVLKEVIPLTRMEHTSYQFREKCGSTVCCELKGITTGTPIHSCADCIMDAAAIVENVLFGGEE